MWRIVIGGFTQSLREPTGCEALWKRMLPACPGEPVQLWPWDADWTGIADQIWRFRPSGQPPRVLCFAYSWGVGFGFLSLAAELAKRGIDLAHAVLCDGVYRPPRRYLGALFAWQALSKTPKILVPANVREVSWFYQRTGLPMGHEVVAADPRRTKINPGILCPGVTHHFMDDQPCWWQKCLEVAAGSDKSGQWPVVSGQWKPAGK